MNRVSGRGVRKREHRDKTDDRLERRTTMKRTVLLLARFVVATLISGWVNLVEALMRPRDPGAKVNELLS